MRAVHLVIVTSLVGIFVCLASSSTWAQGTTAKLRGTVTGADDGVAMAEVEGGGPYHVAATVSGVNAEDENILVTDRGRPMPRSRHASRRR